MNKIVDWDGELQAVYKDGQTFPTTLIRSDEEGRMVRWLIGESPWSGMFTEDGLPVLGSDWTIRSTPAVFPTPDERAVAPKLVARLVAVVKEQVEANKCVTNPSPSLAEARAIVAALEPVDSDKEEAMSVMEGYCTMTDERDRVIINKKELEDFLVASLRRGRQLEKEGK